MEMPYHCLEIKHGSAVNLVHDEKYSYLCQKTQLMSVFGSTCCCGQMFSLM
jgi:hypothetical protein